MEKKAANGWVANETIEYDGWEMRFGNGYTGRANSVSVYEDSTKRMEDKVTYCENIYASKGLPCNFKVTEEDKELSEYLLQRGYKVVTPSDVMILDTDNDEFAFYNYLYGQGLSSQQYQKGILRPVISLKAGIKYTTGDGKSNSPFVIEQ